MTCTSAILLFFFFNDTATTEIYTLSLHDALPICGRAGLPLRCNKRPMNPMRVAALFQRAVSKTLVSLGLLSPSGAGQRGRSEEHTSELQSRLHLVCRLLLEKKKKDQPYAHARSRH